MENVNYCESNLQYTPQKDKNIIIQTLSETKNNTLSIMITKMKYPTIILFALHFFTIAICAPMKINEPSHVFDILHSLDSNKNLHNPIACFDNMNDEILQKISENGPCVSSRIRSLNKYFNLHIPYKTILGQFQEKYGEYALQEYLIRRKDLTTLSDIEFFISRIDIEKKDSIIDDSINIAMQIGNKLILQSLIEHAEDEDVIREKLELACDTGNLNTVEAILESMKLDIAQCGDYSLYLAIRSGHAEIVKVLLSDERMTPQNSFLSLIIIASVRGHANVVKVLIEDGRMDPTFHENEAFISAGTGVAGTEMEVLKAKNEVRKVLFACEKVRNSLDKQTLQNAFNDALISNDIWFAFHISLKCY